MTMFVIGALALMATEVKLQTAVSVAAVAAVAGVMPATAWPLAAGACLVAAVRRWKQKRRAATQLVGDVATICDLVAIALTGGLGLRDALTLAAESVGGQMEGEVSGILRRAQVNGISVALADAAGAGKRVYHVLARAAATGSEIVGPVRRLSDELNAEQGAARLETVHRMPVLMLFPLTMLILPGFLLLAIAPAIVDAFARLDF